MPLVPAISGLQIGTVTKLADDPDNMFRIEVSLRTVGGSGSEPLMWARYCTPYASNNAGLALRPEIGDEVVVGFLDDNPTWPIILGSLHGSSNVPSLAPEDANNFKSLLTREGLKLEFDEENKKITLETPAGSTVVLDDTGKSITMTDQIGNSVKLDGGGISLDSASGVTITAASNVKISASAVTISATADVSISTTADVAISAMNVSASADTSLKATGNASAELSARGTTKVAGALVEIN